MDGDAELARGRDAGRRLAWADAYAALSLADQSSTLAAADLELMATAAYLLGRLEDCHKATATVGVLTPLQGCRKVTWSLSAVVKIALRMFLRFLIVAGVTPEPFSSATHSRTWGQRFQTCASCRSMA